MGSIVLKMGTCTSKQKSTFFICKICLESSTENFKLSKCKCTFCLECVKQYVTHEITNGSTKIKCPESDCKKGQFKLKELEKIVEDELCQKILKFKKDKKVAKSNFKKWCPEPDCNTICKVKTKLKAMKVCCPTCKKEFCSKCSQTWSQHPKKCEDFSGAPTKTELEESIDETKETRPCPVCKVPIQKRGGCYMITCRFCKSNFCWHCMEKVRRHLHIRCKGKINRELGLDIWTGFWIGLTWILVSPIIVLLIPVALSIRTYRLIRWVAPKVKKEIRILMTRLVLTL